MSLPFKIDENASIQLMKTSFNSFIEKCSQQNFQNLIKNHRMLYTCWNDDKSISGLKDWYSEQGAYNGLSGYTRVYWTEGSNGTYVIVPSSTLFEQTTAYAALRINNTNGTRLYQDFVVKDWDIGKSLTVAVVYKLARYRRSTGLMYDPEDPWGFYDYVQKTSTSLDPRPDIWFDVHKTGTTTAPTTSLDMTGLNCHYYDNYTFMDVKQYSLPDSTWRNLRLKTACTHYQYYTESSYDYIIIPAIVGFYVYNSEPILPGLINNVEGLENATKYQNGRWLVTNDGANYKPLINYKEVYVGNTSDAEFLTLTEAMVHSTNVDQKRKYILTSNITEAGDVIFTSDTEIDGRGYTISYANRFGADGGSNPDGTARFTLKNVVLNKCVLYVSAIDKLYIENVKVIKDNAGSYNPGRIIELMTCSGYIDCCLNGDEILSGHTRYNRVSNPVYMSGCYNLNAYFPKIENFGKFNDVIHDITANVFSLTSCENVNITFNEITSVVSALGKSRNVYDFETNVNLATMLSCLRCSIVGNEYNYQIIDVNDDYAP